MKSIIQSATGIASLLLLASQVTAFAASADVQIVFLEGDHRIHNGAGHGVEVHVKIKDGSKIVAQAQPVDFGFLKGNTLLQPKSTRGWFKTGSDFRAIDFEPGIKSDTPILAVRSKNPNVWAGDVQIITGEKDDNPFFKVTDNLRPYGDLGHYVQVSTNANEAELGNAKSSIYLSDRGWIELQWTGGKDRFSGSSDTTFYLDASATLKSLGLRPGTSKNWQDEVFGSVTLMIQPAAFAPVKTTKPDIKKIAEDITSGSSKSDWKYGYGKTGMEFKRFDPPAGNSGLKTSKGPGTYLYAIQNETDKAIVDKGHHVTYPPVTSGAVVLHPDGGFDAKMQFTAPRSGKYAFNIKWELVDEDAKKGGELFSTKVGVWIEGGEKPVVEQVLNGNKYQHTWSDTVQLIEGAKLIIGVHNYGAVTNDSTMVTVN